MTATRTHVDEVIFENVHTRVTYSKGSRVYFIYTLDKKGLPRYITYTEHRNSALDTARAITEAFIEMK